MRVPSSGWRQHLFTENPLCGPAGIAQRRNSSVRVWWTVAQIVLVSHGMSYLVLWSLWSGPPPPNRVFTDPFAQWIANMLAPYLGSLAIPLLLFRLLPRTRDLRSLFTQLRLAGLTPGQITAGHLRRAGQALLTKLSPDLRRFSTHCS